MIEPVPLQGQTTRASGSVRPMPHARRVGTSRSTPVAMQDAGHACAAMEPDLPHLNGCIGEVAAPEPRLAPSRQERFAEVRDGTPMVKKVRIPDPEAREAALRYTVSVRSVCGRRLHDSSRRALPDLRREPRKLSGGTVESGRYLVAAGRSRSRSAAWTG